MDYEKIMRLVKVFASTDAMSVPGDAHIDVAANLIVEHDISDLPVVDEFGDLIGLVSESDVLRRYCQDRAKNGHVGQRCRDHMTTEYRTICKDATLETAARIFQAVSVRHLILVDGNKPVDVLSRRDVVRALRDGRLDFLQH